MRALIMAGGAGSRLGHGEKPLILICNRPMISFIIDTFHSAGCDPVVAVSPNTPMTANWCRAHDIPLVRTEGLGYVEDTSQAILALGEEHPLFISVSDIPGIAADIVTTIRKTYDSCEKDALSTWIPAARVISGRGGMPYHEFVNGIDSCPAGINIIRGNSAGSEQDEFALLLDDPRLALNVNTPEDRSYAESFLLTHRAR